MVWSPFGDLKKFQFTGKHFNLVKICYLPCYTHVAAVGEGLDEKWTRQQALKTRSNQHAALDLLLVAQVVTIKHQFKKMSERNICPLFYHCVTDWNRQ